MSQGVNQISNKSKNQNDLSTSTFQLRLFTLAHKALKTTTVPIVLAFILVFIQQLQFLAILFNDPVFSFS